MTSKGNKHSFKAANTAERDNWVAQLKLKITEAKELTSTVTESEKYKTTLESYKPKPIAKKEETPVVAAAEAPKEETPAVEEPVKDAEAVKEEDKVEEPKKAESPKPLKNKRASFFGFLDKKDKPVEEKKEETKVEEPVKTEETPVVAPVVAPIEADKPAEEVKPVEETPAVAPVAEADKTVEEPKAESPKEKSSKRNSFFGGILSKKEKKVAEPKPEEKKDEITTEEPKTEETAPVIPPVEATTPLAVDVNNTATTPAAETAESPVATGETKKDTKERRKSSLPFLGKREKSPAPAEGEEKPTQSAFSKFRATIKGKSAPKEEKKDEVAKEETKTEEVKAEDKKDDVVVAEPAKVEPIVDDAAKPVEPETKPENVATTTPAVTAAA